MTCSGQSYGRGRNFSSPTGVRTDLDGMSYEGRELLPVLAREVLS